MKRCGCWEQRFASCCSAAASDAALEVLRGAELREQWPPGQ